MLNKNCFMYHPEKDDYCECLRQRSAKKFHKNDELSDCPFAKTMEQQLSIEEKCKTRLLNHKIRFKSRATGEISKPSAVRS